MINETIDSNSALASEAERGEGRASAREEGEGHKEAAAGHTHEMSVGKLDLLLESVG